MPRSVNSGPWSRVKGEGMKIGEVAGAAGVSVDTVRFYERVGVLPPPARTESGYRDYASGTIERIRLTRQLQAIGFTLNDTVDALAAHDAGGATCESERWRLDSRCSTASTRRSPSSPPSAAGSCRRRRRAIAATASSAARRRMEPPCPLATYRG